MCDTLAVIKPNGICSESVPDEQPRSQKISQDHRYWNLLSGISSHLQPSNVLAVFSLVSVERVVMGAPVNTISNFKANLSRSLSYEIAFKSYYPLSRQ